MLALVLTALLSIPAVALAAVQDHAAPGLTPRGTTINVFDYWIGGQDESDDSNPDNYQYRGINAGEVLKFGKGMGNGDADDRLNAETVNQWTQTREPRQGIVADELGSDGYPVLVQSLRGDSLSYLFDPTEEHAGKESFSNVGGLLRVDEDGYYYYDCHDNFAQFDETGNTFLLYPDWAVNAGGASGNGQFFPFDSGNEVFDERYGNLTQNGVTSENARLNHYFGLTMTTNFVQQFGGHTDETRDQAVTYNFSGDDDVWIFIDGVLVGDLGGIHNTSSIQIDFSTGEVVVYDDANFDNVFDDVRRDEETYQETTLRALFEAAGRDVSNFEGDTLPDGSYHSLDFFYLERGNVDSNMSLKYNLVTIPETDITKVDQEGNFVAGATFQVTDSFTGEEICTAVTENDGTVVLLDENDYPITIDELYAERRINLTFTETETPTGYRGVGSIELYIQHYEADQTANNEETNVLLSSDPWTTGAYAQSKVTVTAADEVRVNGQGLREEEKQSGMMFVVVEKHVDGAWRPVTGDALNGWTVSSSTESDMQAVIDAGRSTNAVFVIASSGAYQAEVENLPGRVQDYEFFKSGTREYRGRYFYTSASSWDEANASNTYEIQNADDFDRQFSARVYISNIVNRVLVQKVDEAGNAVNGATMGLYSNDQVTVDPETGVATLTAGAQPSQTAMTRTLSKEGGDSIDLNGAAIFTKLTPGTYWVGEVSAPAGYVPSTSLAKVIVDGTGVYADAGTADDGVSVTRGIGRVVRSMIQFATDDDIDASLHDVVATPMTGTSVGDWASIEGVDPLHLSYADDEDAVLDYEAFAGSEQRLKVETGIPYLKVQQCNETTAGENVHSTEPRQNLENTDLTNLFTGVTIVHIENERTASLEVTKELEKDAALVGPSATTSYQITFSFTFPDGTNVDELPLTAQVFDAEGDAVGEEFAFTVDQQGGWPFGGTYYTRPQGLEAGQTIKLYGLPNGITYTITETGQDGLPDGVTLKSITNADNVVDEGTDAEATGTVEATTAGAQADHVTVTNQYTAEPTDLSDTQSQFKGEKTLDGRDWVTGEQIDFVLSTAVGDTVTPMPQGATTVGEDDEAYLTSRVTRSENGGFTFEDITYDKAGTYTYTITEDAASHSIAGGTEEQNAAIRAGMTYSSAKYEVTVDVTDVPDGQETGNGQLRVASVTYRQVAPESGDATIASFVNEFDAAATTGQLYAFKTYEDTTTGNPADEGQFSATLRPAGENAATAPMPAGAEGEGAGRTITTSFSGAGSALSAAFGEMSFQYAGAEQTYYYEVSENLPEGATADNNYTVGGMIYDPTVYTARVTVSAAQSSTGATTQLTYAIAQSAYEDITQDTVWTSFSPSATRDDSQPLFTNTYRASSDEGDTNAQITGNKNITGRTFAEGETFTFSVSVSAMDENGQPIADAPLPSNVQDGTYTLTIADSAGKNSAQIDLGGMTFTKVGTYTYTITETGGSNDGFGYDTDARTVVITVTDDGDGTLSVSQQVTGGQQLTWQNNYTSQTSYAGLNIEKTMSGRELADNEFSFKIVPNEGNPAHAELGALFGEGGALHDAISYGDAQGADSATLTVLQGIEFTQADAGKTFSFTVSEVTGTESGVDYDKSEYLVTIEVADDTRGGLSTTTKVTKVVDSDGNEIATEDQQTQTFTNSKAQVSFSNSYATQPTTSEGVADGMFTKSFTGRAWAEGDSFTFNIAKKSYQASEGAEVETDGAAVEAMPLPEQTSATVTLADLNPNSTTDASFGFGTITFSKPGIYTYEVRETPGASNNGITYSDNVATVVFTVTDTTTGQYDVECSITYSDASENGVFQNTYAATGWLPGAANLAVEKVFTGRPNDTWLETDEFSFTLAPDMSDEQTKAAVDAGQIVIGGDNPSSETVTIDDEDVTKTTSFNNITFSQPGNHTYKFIVSEVQPTGDGVTQNEQGQSVKDGITYDNSQKTVVVSVKDDGNGNLTAELGEGGDELVFTNTYATGSTTITSTDLGLNGTKELTGRTWENGDSFTFLLTPGVCENPNGTQMTSDEVAATMPATKSVTITPATDDSATDGDTAVFTFAAEGAETFTFTKPGTYRYLIEEENPYVPDGGSGIIGVNYDETRYRVTIEVTDNAQGGLEVTEHAISESVPGSTNEYVDLGQGEGIVFTNSYSADAAEINFNAAKVLQGRPSAMADNEFVFRIEDAGWRANGTQGEWTVDSTNPMPADFAEDGVNTRGDIEFGTISFTHDNVGKTYRYAITEVQPTEDGTVDGTPLEGAEMNDAGQWVYRGVTYDNSVKYVTAEVTSSQIEDPNNSGQYIEAISVTTSGEATWDDESEVFVGDAIFTNTYASSQTISGADSFAVEKILNGRDEWTTNDIFTFTLTGSEGAPMPDGSDGNVKTIAVAADDMAGGIHANNFGDITYTQVDHGKTYTYVIEETAGNLYGMTYSKASYTVTVKVTDDGTGTLVVERTLTQTADDNGGTDDVSASPQAAVFTNTYDEPKDIKTVTSDVAGAQTDVNGQLVGVGDTLTYTIHWVNNAVDEQGVAAPAEVTVTDVVPAGTELLDQESYAYDAETRTITWKLDEQEAAAEGDLTFQVVVTEDAVSYDEIANTADVYVGENDPKTTNRVTVEVPKKDATDETPETGLQVGDTISYSVEWANLTGSDAEVTVTDTLPEGVTYNNDASDGGTYDPNTRTITWNLGTKANAERGTVTFTATVNEQATVVEDPLTNTAYVTVGDDTHKTNTTNPGDEPATGDLRVDKDVVALAGSTVDGEKSFSFAISLKDASGADLAGTYLANVYNEEGTQVGPSDFEITNGSTFTLKDGEYVIISDLPEGARYDVTETLDATGDAGYSQVSEGAEGTIPVGDDNAAATFTNTYSPGSSTYDPEGEHGVKVTKQVFGNVDGLSPEGYEFTMTVVNAATNDATGIESGTPQTKTSSASGAVDFDDVTFSQVGDYTVTVSETPGTDEHTTYDGHQLVYTVRVYDAGNGQLVAEAVEDTVSKGESIFTNLSYNEEDAKHVSDGQTVIDGKTVGVGETLTYSIDWVNTAQDDSGSPAAATVTVVDTLPQGVTLVEGSYGEGAYDAEAGTITWTIEATPAQVGTVSFQVTVDPAAAGTTIENSASVNGVDTNTVTNPVPGKEETSRPGEIGEGTVLTYQISFTNTDGAGATAEVVDSLTKGQDYIEGSAVVNGQKVEPTVAGDAANGQTLTWNLADLAANEQVTIVFSVTLTRDAGTSVDNTATVNGHKTNTTTTPYPTDDKKDVFQADDPTTSVNGKLVGVGDELTYTIDWAADEDGTLTVTDVIPAGTALVEGSISEGGVLSDDGTTITWALGEKNAGDKGTVSFNVTVTNDAVDHDPITNSASIQVGENDPKVVTATTDIPKKIVEDTTPETGLQVGDVLDYAVEWANDSGETATVTVTDTLPAGLTYVEGSASDGGTYDPETRTVTWTLEGQPDGAEGSVSFSARVNEDAPTIEDPLTNTAYVTVGDDIYQTNTTNDDEKPATGNLTISKQVVIDSEGAETEVNGNQAFQFTIALTDAEGTSLTKGYAATVHASDGQDYPFTIGNEGVSGAQSTFELRHGESVTISGLPEGATYTVTEAGVTGYNEGKETVQEGTVLADGSEVTFTNTYTLEPTTFDLAGTKHMSGRDFQVGDSFTFHVNADEGTPLPSGVDESGNVTITPSEGSEAAIGFGTIDISRPGEYTYLITEQPTGLSGVSYDETTHTVTIIATDNGQGGLDVEMSTDASALSWTNEWAFAGSVSFSLDGTKTLTGRELANGQFTFLVEPQNGAPMGSSLPANFNGDAVDNGDGSWTAPVTLLQGIELTQPGDYVYLISEVDDGQPGYEYDTATFRVTASVAQDGTLTTTIEKSSEVDGEEVWTKMDAVAFVNSYRTEGEATLDGATNLSGTKTLSGRDWIDTDTLKDSFTFLLVPASDATTEAVERGAIKLPETTVVLQGGYSDGAEVPFGFGDVTFSEPGDYAFAISEQQPGAEGFVGITGGMTYDSHVYLVSVSVADNGRGGLAATVTGVEGEPSWVNVYVPGDEPGTLSGAANLMVTKVIDGRDWISDDPVTSENEADSFTFTLSADEANPEGATLPEETTLTIDAATENHQAAFGDITFSQPGDYVFYITEQQGSAGGMTYDTTRHAVTVHVEDNLDGTLSVMATEGANPTITNVYQPTGEVEVQPVEGQFQLTKVLEGKAWDGDEFTFELTAKTGTAADGSLLRPEDGTIPMPEATTVTVGEKTGTNAEGNDFATFGFGPISYDAAGTYVYEVRELPGDNAGMDYDGRVATVTVKVTDNLQGGYAAAVQVEGSFTNIYATEVDYNAEGGLSIVKRLFGHDMTSEVPFEFTVTAEDEASAAKVGIDTTTLWKTLTTGDATMVNGVASTSLPVFDAAEFTQEDVGAIYRYTVSETRGGDEALGYTNSDVVYTVEITTADDGNGRLTVTTHVTGTDGTDQTYVYSNVADAAQGGTATLRFDNEYDASGTLGGSGSVGLAASKSLVNGLLAGGEFTFEVSASNGETIKVYATTTNGADGSIVFPAIEFTTDGMLADVADGYATLAKSEQGADVYSYQFRVSETGELPAGVTQVDASFVVGVTVTDNSDGTLDVAVTYPEGSDSLEFVNAYGAGEKAELSVAGTKTLRVLSGNNAPDIAGDFTFTLTGVDEDGNPAPLPEVTEATNDASGNVTFGTITYTMENVFGGIATIDGDAEAELAAQPRIAAHEDKVYTYTVSESGSVAGVDNDPLTTRTFTVTVHDNGDGTLSVSCSETPGAQFAFVNTYGVDPVDDEPTKDEGGFTVLKTLDGRALNEGEFTFVLKTADGEEVSRGTNDAEGNVEMSAVHFEDAGVYEYLLSEVDNNLGGVSYDSSFYQVSADVRDNGDGTLSVTWTLGSAKGEALPDNTARFNNAYDIVRPGSIVFGASKVLDGRVLAEGEFAFQLKDEAGNVLQEARSSASGSVVFADPVYFSEAGEYVFTVSEVLPTDDDAATPGIQSDGVTYDETVYTATVTVVDNGDGSTTATVSYGTDGTLPAFRNVYVEPERPVEPSGPVDEGPDTGGTPDTGDRTNAAVPAVLGLVGATLIGGALYARRRRG